MLMLDQEKLDALRPQLEQRGVNVEALPSPDSPEWDALVQQLSAQDLTLAQEFAALPYDPDEQASSELVSRQVQRASRVGGPLKRLHPLTQTRTVNGDKVPNTKLIRTVLLGAGVAAAAGFYFWQPPTATKTTVTRTTGQAASAGGASADAQENAQDDVASAVPTPAEQNVDPTGRDKPDVLGLGLDESAASPTPVTDAPTPELAAGGGGTPDTPAPSASTPTPADDVVADSGVDLAPVYTPPAPAPGPSGAPVDNTPFALDPASVPGPVSPLADAPARLEPDPVASPTRARPASAPAPVVLRPDPQAAPTLRTVSSARGTGAAGTLTPSAGAPRLTQVGGEASSGRSAPALQAATGSAGGAAGAGNAGQSQAPSRRPGLQSGSPAAGGASAQGQGAGGETARRAGLQSVSAQGENGASGSAAARPRQPGLQGSAASSAAPQSANAGPGNAGPATEEAGRSQGPRPGLVVTAPAARAATGLVTAGSRTSNPDAAANETGSAARQAPSAQTPAAPVAARTPAASPYGLISARPGDAEAREGAAAPTAVAGDNRGGPGGYGLISSSRSGTDTRVAGSPEVGSAAEGGGAEGAQRAPAAAEPPYQMGQELAARLTTVAAAADGIQSNVPVYAQTEDGALWRGAASLDARRRLQITFTAVVKSGREYALVADVYSADRQPGLAVSVRPTAPTAAYDILSAFARSAQSFVQATLAQKTVTYQQDAGGGGVTTTTNTTPPNFWLVTGAGLASAFSLPENRGASVIFVGQVPSGTTVKMIVRSIGAAATGNDQ